MPFLRVPSLWEMLGALFPEPAVTGILLASV
jgi:hypothetical protein